MPRLRVDLTEIQILFLALIRLAALSPEAPSRVNLHLHWSGDLLKPDT